MSAQPPGRRTESLFDNRYRYDYIFPRGRSGETLRAYDTQDDDRPVVIKRPAPQDAPPMRAGQEVSIRTEKQALERLSGHPILTELRGSGTFRVGGHTHEYIVMDLARGHIVENIVLELAEQGQYLPELETLVIIDNLLDLLARAHDQQVVYNDVDAKHLFWDRDTYRLKVIDWGNAVFLDEPGALPTVTRATDVYQVGELLYFILTGGNRLAVEVEGGDTFFVNFGADAERIPARLQTMLTRAVHPDPKRRYATIMELRYALADYRQPLARARDEIVARVRKRVRATASQEELEELAESLREALTMDPGNPDANALAAEIQRYLRQIRVQADLDAIRIYLESENWARALSLLHDLLPNADETNEALIRFLIAASAMLEERHLSPPPAGFFPALEALFQGDAPGAGHALSTVNEARGGARQTQWLLAEHLAIQVKGVTLLRPHLMRLRHDLDETPGTTAGLAWLDEIDAELARAPSPGLIGLRIIYQQAITLLDQLDSALETASVSLSETTQERLLAAIMRAQRAAQEVIARLDDLGHYACSDSARANDLLRHAAMIDPASPHFDALRDYFDEARQALAALGQFKPRGDGGNLREWFEHVQDFLRPYLDDLPDPQLLDTAAAVRRAAEGWTTAVNYLALGRHQPTIDTLRATADTIRPVNEQIAAWLGTVANRLPDAPFAERLSPNAALADTLIEGWKVWDRGDGTHAAELGRRARELGTTDGERLAADRLRRMGELLDSWLSEGGPQDPERTDQAETQALAVLLTEEERERRTFAEQMPNTTTYLRAMSRGIVAYMRQSSSAGWRALYMHYVLRGTLALLDDALDETEFWRSVADRSYENAPTHRAFQILDRGLTARRLVQTAQRALNALSGPADLDSVRQALNAPLAGEVLTGAEQAIHLIGDALRDWSDGDFYAARQTLDQALQEMERAVEAAHLKIDSFMAWLTRLRDTAAELHQLRLTIEQGATTTREEPDPSLAEAHARIVALTRQTLGPDYAHQVRQWEDMYQAVLETYSSQRFTRREKLAAFSRHFASLFIARHPAYPLFRHWEEVIEQLPPDEAEDDMIEIDKVAPPDGDAPAYLVDDHEPVPIAQTESVSDLPWNWIIGMALLALIVAAGFAVLRAMNRDESGSVRVSQSQPTATIDLEAIVPATSTRAATVAPSPLPPTLTAPPTVALTATPITPGVTFPPTQVPSATRTEIAPPTLTPTPFATSAPIPSVTPPQDVAVASASGDRDALAALAALPVAARPGPDGAFAPDDGGAWVIATGINSSVSIELSPQLINALFQPGAANTFRRADATMTLTRSDSVALAQGDIAFGLGAENATGQRTIGQVQFVETTVVSVGLNQNGQFRSTSQYPQQAARFALSIRRTNANTLGFFVDEKWLGDSVFLFTQGEPLTLILYVSGKDVEVTLSAFALDFSARDEMP